MHGKLLSRPVVPSVLKFMLVFGLLIAPWPEWNHFYSSYFQQMGRVAFSSELGKREVEFASNNAPSRPSMDTVMSLGNRDLIDSTGRGLRAKTELDTRSIGWIPTALTIALIIATPISLRRRFCALLGGLFLVHVFILFTLQSWIWNNSPAVSLLTFSNFGKILADELDYTLMNQIGASFSIPVLIWIIVTFRRQDELPAI